MLAVVNGLRVHRVSRSALVRNTQYRHFVASSSLGNPAPVATPEADAAAVAAKKTGRATYLFIGVAAAAVLGTLAYPQLVNLPPTVKPTPVPTPVTPPTISPPPPRTLSPREELNQRLEALKAELAQLRKQKRNQLIDVKKRAIKDEIKMIESGLAKLEKS